MAETDKSDRFAGKLTDARIIEAEISAICPLACMYARIMRSDEAVKMQNQAEGKLCNGAGRIGGRVGYHDAAFFGSHNIHDVIAGGEQPNVAEI